MGTAISNEGSKYTALGVGFVEDRVNTVIRKKGSEKEKGRGRLSFSLGLLSVFA